MPVLKIKDIDVSFPHDPYPCQLNYMESVIQSLLSSSNALLESPTGTGKTLCLLCSILSWQRHMIQSTSNIIEIQYQSGPNLPTNKTQRGSLSPSASSIIIYASRTHNQLSQVISELKSTTYRPKVSVLGSRELLCVNEKISKLRGNLLNHACNSLTAQRKCQYKTHLESFSGPSEGGGSLLDIEQLGQMGKRDSICPYFYSRELAESAELILLPYNYLLEPSIRASLKIEWKNAVIIFDEAHNLEKVASDAASMAFTSVDTASCIAELQQVLTHLQSSGDVSLQQSQPLHESKGKKPLVNDGDAPCILKTAKILKALFDAESRIHATPLSTKGPGDLPCCVHRGMWLGELLEASGFSYEQSFHDCLEIRRCADFLMEKAQTEMRGGGSATAISEPKLSLLSKLLALAFRGRSKAEYMLNTNEYQVYLCEEDHASQASAATIMRRKRVLNYWCFSPGLAMEDLNRLGVRSVIVTSGTMSPIASFRADLRLPFPVVLENPHVISDKQIWVGAVSVGPGGQQLNSSFADRDSREYKDDLGAAILQICVTMAGRPTTVGAGTALMGPELKAGVLCFFPSYGALESSVKRWGATGMFTQLRAAMGAIITESQNKATTGARTKPAEKENTSSAFVFGQNRPVASEPSDDRDAIVGIIAEFEAALRQHGKCLMLAVCRGKISEGIDFKDSKGRVVIITGIPFAPTHSPWVVLKKQHLDNCRTRGRDSAASQALLVQSLLQRSSIYAQLDMTASASVSGNNATKAQFVGGKQALQPTTEPPLTGSDWYFQSASRAVNQAIGRIIRHRHDWGAVFLLDNRFLADRQVDQLSAWLRPRVKKYNSFATAAGEFRAFLTAAMTDPYLDPKSRIPVPAPRISRPQPPPQSLQKSSTEVVRHVVLSASALGLKKSGDEHSAAEGKELTYVDPALLMSQQKQKPPQPPSSRGGAFQLTSSASQLYADEDSHSPQAKETGNDSLLDIISKMKKAAASRDAGTSSQLSQEFEAQTQPPPPPATGMLLDVFKAKQFATSAGFATSLSQPALSASNRTTNAILALSKQHNSLSQRRAISGGIFGASSSFTSTARTGDGFGQTSSYSSHGLSTKTTAASQGQPKAFSWAQPSSGSLTSSSQPPSSTNKSFFSGSVRSTASSGPSAPQSSSSSSSTSSQYRRPQQTTLQTPTKTVSQQEAPKSAATSLLKRARTAPATSSAAAASPASLTNIDESLPKRTSNTAADVDDNVAQRGSKRARMIFAQASNPNPATGAAAKPANMLSLITGLELTKRGGGNRDSISKIKTADVKCAVCLNKVRNVLAARHCGHTCCNGCWDTWLKVNPTCPVCRSATSKADLVRLLIRESL